MSGAAKKPTNPRGDSLPREGFGLEIDGKIKSQHATPELAFQAGLEIKQKFPLLQVKVFDAVTRIRRPVEPLAT